MRQWATTQRRCGGETVLRRMEAFDKENGDKVSVCTIWGCYTLTLTPLRSRSQGSNRKGQATGYFLTTGHGKPGGKTSATWSASCSRSTKPSTKSPIPTSSGRGPEEKNVRSRAKSRQRCREPWRAARPMSVLQQFCMSSPAGTLPRRLNSCNRLHVPGPEHGGLRTRESRLSFARTREICTACFRAHQASHD